MRGYGTYDVPAGSWSDDTSMTLAFMDAVVSTGRLDYEEVMRNFDAWISTAKYTPGGDVFDAGGTCVSSIRSYCMHIDGGDPIKPEESGMDADSSNGNGSLMRFVLVPLYCDARGISGDELVRGVNDSSSLTHRQPVSRLGCYIYTKYVTAVNLGEDTDTVAAITGSITGILYGSDSMPAEWLKVLARTDELVDLAKRYDEAIRR